MTVLSQFTDETLWFANQNFGYTLFKIEKSTFFTIKVLNSITLDDINPFQTI